MPAEGFGRKERSLLKTSASGLIHVLHYEPLAMEIGLFTIAPVAQFAPS